MNKTAILTLDYEIFGNGSGNIFTNLIEPMESLLNIANEYNVKYTIFFEAIEFLRIKQEFEGGNSQGYDSNPIVVVEEQIRNAYLEGHDVQLHIHPQWANASWSEGKWILDNNHWALGSFGKDKKDLVSLILEGKNYLESIIKQVAPNYKCLVIRAGAYSLQPSERVAKAMADLDILVDSSIVPGAVNSASRSPFDYSDIDQTLDYWWSKDRLEISQPGNLCELPLAVFPLRRYKKLLSLSAIRSRLRNKASSLETLNAKTGKDKGFLGKVRYVTGVEFQTWDFCILPKAVHKLFLSKAERSEKKIYVLVGHPKGFQDASPYRWLLREMKGKFSFETISSIYKFLKTNT